MPDTSAEAQALDALVADVEDTETARRVLADLTEEQLDTLSEAASVLLGLAYDMAEEIAAESDPVDDDDDHHEDHLTDIIDGQDLY